MIFEMSVYKGEEHNQSHINKWNTLIRNNNVVQCVLIFEWIHNLLFTELNQILIVFIRTHTLACDYV